MHLAAWHSKGHVPSHDNFTCTRCRMQELEVLHMELRWTHLLPHLRLTRRKEARPAHSRHVLGQENLHRLGYKIKPQRSIKKPILTIQIRWISECIPCHVVSKAIAVYKLQSDQWNQHNSGNLISFSKPPETIWEMHTVPFLAVRKTWFLSFKKFETSFIQFQKHLDVSKNRGTPKMDGL